jgi:hypothetical protein
MNNSSTAPAKSCMFQDFNIHEVPTWAILLAIATFVIFFHAIRRKVKKSKQGCNKERRTRGYRKRFCCHHKEMDQDNGSGEESESAQLLAKDQQDNGEMKEKLVEV